MSPTDVLAAALAPDTDPAVARWLFLGGAVLTLGFGAWALIAPTSCGRVLRSTKSGARRTPQNVALYGVAMLAVAAVLGVAALITWNR